MAEVRRDQCDVFGSFNRVKVYTIVIHEHGRSDEVVLHENVYLSRRALDRLDRLINKGVNPPGTKADDSEPATETPNDETKS